eukprot:SAG22_NODE_3659_length_1590_cov_0.918176_4_plen_41_part_00
MAATARRLGAQLHHLQPCGVAEEGFSWDGFERDSIEGVRS